MADTKYSGFATTTPAPGDILAVSHSLSSFSVTVSSIVQAINSSIPGLTIASISSVVQSINSSIPAFQFTSKSQAGTVVLGAANTFSTAVSLSLIAGTWMVDAVALVGRNSAANSTVVYARLHDGTNEFAVASAALIGNLTSTYVSLPLNAIVTYGNTSTLNVDAAGSVVTTFIRARPFANAGTSTATMITALKIA